MHSPPVRVRVAVATSADRSSRWTSHWPVLPRPPLAGFRVCTEAEENTQTVNAESGQTYYFRLDPGFGGVSINRITAEAGRDLVSKTQRLPSGPKDR